MARSDERQWTQSDIAAAYAEALPPVGDRVSALLACLATNGRLMTGRRAGPAFGVMTDDRARVVSIRERRVDSRVGVLDYFPANVVHSSNGQNRTFFETAFEALELPPINADNGLPGHHSMGNLETLTDHQFEGLLELLEGLGPLPANDLDDPPESLRRDVRTSRIVRDSRIVRELKTLYGNRCQLCGVALADPGGNWSYSEGHHLKPLGKPHNGPDQRSNVLIVCPNHHAILDFAVIPLDAGSLALNKHALDVTAVRYHNELHKRNAAS